MLRRYYVILSLVLCLVLIPVPSARAQYGSNLEPNKTRSTEHMWSYSSRTYHANLTAGSWTVVVKSDAFWGMSFTIRVTDPDTSEVLAETEESSARTASVKFTLEEDTLVIILLEEVGGGAGYYDIGVYSGLNAIAATYGIWLIIIPSLIIGIAIAVVCCIKLRQRPAEDQEVRVEAPEFAIPERHRQRAEAREIRTVRLPAKCPSCGASLSQEDIDWVGPLEAECNYCGAVVKARLEKL